LIIDGLEMGQIYLDIPDKLEKELRFKTVEKLAGDLSKAVEEAVETRVAKEK